MKFAAILLLYVLCINADSTSFGSQPGDVLSHFGRSTYPGGGTYNPYNYQIDQLIKKISELSSNISAVDKIKKDLSNVNTKTSKIEQLIFQEDEKIKKETQKIISALEHTKNQLNGRLMDIQDKIYVVKSTPFATLSRVENALSFIVSKLNDTKPVLTKQTLVSESTFKSEIMQLKDIAFSQSNAIKALSMNVNVINAEIKNFKTSLDNVKDRTYSMQRQLQQSKCNLTCNISPYSTILTPMKNMINNISDKIQQLPRAHDMQAIQQQIVMRLKNTENNIKDVLSKEITNLEKKLSPNQIIRGPAELRLYRTNNASNMNQNNFVDLYNQLALMDKNIVDNKHILNNGVQQILSEIGTLVKEQASNINNNLIRRINVISNDIAGQEQKILLHLTSKMEQKMNQVLQEIYSIRECVKNLRNENVQGHWATP